MSLNPWPTVEWDPLLGCVPKSTGCLRCYAAQRIGRKSPKSPAIKWSGDVAMFTGQMWMAREHLQYPLMAPKPQVVFTCAHSDMFAPPVQDRQKYIIWQVMVKADWHQFNVLTKNPETMAKFIHDYHLQIPNHIRIGISAETSALLNERWEAIRELPTHWVHLSLEPMLEPMTLPLSTHGRRVWVVVMAEVGPALPRPLDPAWVRDMRDQCKVTGLPFFWETTTGDGIECVNERNRARESGEPYRTQEQLRPLPLHQSGLLVTGNSR